MCRSPTTLHLQRGRFATCSTLLHAELLQVAVAHLADVDAAADRTPCARVCRDEYHVDQGGLLGREHQVLNIAPGQSSRDSLQALPLRCWAQEAPATCRTSARTRHRRNHHLGAPAISPAPTKSALLLLFPAPRFITFLSPCKRAHTSQGVLVCPRWQLWAPRAVSSISDSRSALNAALECVDKLLDGYVLFGDQLLLDSLVTQRWRRRSLRRFGSVVEAQQVGAVLGEVVRRPGV